MGLLQKAGIKYFFQPNTPDSIIKKYEGYLSFNYELGYEGDNIALGLYGDTYLKDFHNWLAGNNIEFVWDGERFIKQKPTFKD